MRTVVASHCLFYVCPNCRWPMTIPIHRTVEGSFKCRHCHAAWTVLELMQMRTEFNPMAVEFRCLKCSERNIIIAAERHTWEEAFTPHPGLTIVQRHRALEKPEYGLCEHCLTDYQLTYREKLVGVTYASLEQQEPDK